MKTSRWASALSALILGLANGRAAGQAKGSNDMAERVSKPVVYQVEGMDKVRVRKDLVYKKDGAVELKMDISTPEKQKPGESLPVVFFIHVAFLAMFRSSRKIGGSTGRGAGSSRRREWPGWRSTTGWDTRTRT